MMFGRIDLCGDYGLGPQACFTGLEAIGAIAGVIGTAVSAAGTIAAGQAAKDDAEFKAKQLERKANEERAASQREADTKKKELDLVLSRQQAGAAASGLGSLDTTILDLAGDTTVQGEMNQRMVRYGGEERRAGLLDQATAARATGKAEQTGSYFKAGGTLLDGFSSFAQKYGSLKPTGGGGGSLYG